MKLMKKTVALLLVLSFGISPVLETMAHGKVLQKHEAGKVIVVSEKVGETIDLEENNYYRLFPDSENFRSAVFLQQSDSSFVALITEEKEGVKNFVTKEIDRQTLDRLRENITKFKNSTPIDKASFFPPKEELRKAKILEAKEQAEILKAKIKAAKKQANVLAKEKWTKERWREEIRYDRGRSYRTTKAMLGFTLGAAAGMLIGKGFQGKKVERQVHHEGWDSPDWTENLYSYEHKNAPHWGAAIGGTAGAVAGYFLGKKADKKYYILVPKHIRMMEPKSSGLGNTLFGFLLVGPAMGAIAGVTLYTPTSGKEGGIDFGWARFRDGYIVSSIIGTIIVAGYNGRAKRMRLWEKSLLEEKPESSLNIRFMPSDPSAFTSCPRKLPSGEIFYEYRMDMLRLRF